MNAFADSFAIRRAYGMEGYGIYVWLIERCATAQDRRLKVDVDAFAWEMRVDADVVHDIIASFDLFVVEDGYIRDARTDGNAAKPKSKARSEAAKRAWARKKAQEAEERQKNDLPLFETVEKEETQTTPRVDDAEIVDEPTTLEENPDVAAFNRVVARWNELYKGTQRVVKQLNPSPTMWKRFIETYKQHGEEEILAACEETRNVTTFAWTLRAVLNPDKDNVQLLLSQKENRENREKERSNGSAWEQSEKPKPSYEERIRIQRELYGNDPEPKVYSSFDELAAEYDF
jgi:hypothetical protein